MNVSNFNVLLTNDVVSFEKPGPALYLYHYKMNFYTINN